MVREFALGKMTIWCVFAAHLSGFLELNSVKSIWKKGRNLEENAGGADNVLNVACRPPGHFALVV